MSTARDRILAKLRGAQPATPNPLPSLDDHYAPRARGESVAERAAEGAVDNAQQPRAEGELAESAGIGADALCVDHRLRHIAGDIAVRITQRLLVSNAARDEADIGRLILTRRLPGPVHADNDALHGSPTPASLAAKLWQPNNMLGSGAGHSPFS